MPVPVCVEGDRGEGGSKGVWVVCVGEVGEGGVRGVRGVKGFRGVSGEYWEEVARQRASRSAVSPYIAFICASRVSSSCGASPGMAARVAATLLRRDPRLFMLGLLYVCGVQEVQEECGPAQ
jgi:hypothetical protein